MNEYLRAVEDVWWPSYEPECCMLAFIGPMFSIPEGLPIVACIQCSVSTKLSRVIISQDLHGCLVVLE